MITGDWNSISSDDLLKTLYADLKPVLPIPETKLHRVLDRAGTGEFRIPERKYKNKKSGRREEIK